MYEEKTPEGIRGEILANLGTEVDKREGSFAADMAAPVALELWKLYDSLNAVLPIAFVDESSGEYIDKRCGDYGIVRKAGTFANVMLCLTGQAGTVVPEGSIFVTDEGLQYASLTEVILPESGTVEAEAKATKAGDVYNVAAGEIHRQLTALPGLTGVTNGKAAAGGSDPETDGALVERLYAYLRRPATSGNIDHYRQWALEVSGVGDARIMSLWDGPGTVRVLIVGPGKEPVAEEVRQACAEHIEEMRPIGAAVTVASAEGMTVNVAAQAVLESSVTAAEVKKAFGQKLEEYLRSLAFVTYEVLYNRVAFLLLDTPGVTDYTGLTLNGGTGNLEIGAEQVPVLGEVSVS